MNTADLVREIAAYRGRPLTLMEVCGTHTAAISESGIPSLLPPTVRLISGPGCPVCVTVSAYIDRLIELATAEGTCVVSFGDLLRVKGSHGDLRSTEGARVEMVYTPFKALELAENDPDTTFVFAAVGFETTAPIYALLAEQIIARGLKNLKLLTALKTMPAVIRTLCAGDHAIDGFITPGHVATVTGSALFRELAEETGKPFAVAGFTAPSLLAAILALTRSAGKASLFNFYPSAVTEEGNREALDRVNRYFEPCTAAWRGLGAIPHSGLRLRDEYAHLDAGSDALTEDHVPAGCHCGEVIAGRCAPADCPLFGKACTPENPFGACMVSMEGACYHHYINDRR
ncbi:MAG: hydrogenase formation protein HypD [Clostridia bacterium]|nr:hydrogenase formation protein HypD [Clostridia bacterium]